MRQEEKIIKQMEDWELDKEMKNKNRPGSLDFRKEITKHKSSYN
jgi:hypothetical protein